MKESVDVSARESRCGVCKKKIPAWTCSVVRTSYSGHIRRRFCFECYNISSECRNKNLSSECRNKKKEGANNV